MNEHGGINENIELFLIDKHENIELMNLKREIKENNEKTKGETNPKLKIIGCELCDFSCNNGRGC